MNRIVIAILNNFVTIVARGGALGLMEEDSVFAILEASRIAMNVCWDRGILSNWYQRER